MHTVPYFFERRRLELSVVCIIDGDVDVSSHNPHEKDIK